MPRRPVELALAGLGFILCAVLFIGWPEIDLWASGLFYRGDGLWSHARSEPLLAIPYRGLPRLGQALLLVLAGALLLSFVRAGGWLRARRPFFVFLLVGALLGPIFAVDVIIKEHSGRARPVNVVPFGGERMFTPAFMPADQCAANCAFVSGHVATAAFVMAFGWLAAPAVRRRWLIASLAFAAYMSFIRMSPGGHFLSDCVFAWFTTYFSLWAAEWLCRRLGWLYPSRASGGH